jgi:hypothetical protein
MTAPAVTVQLTIAASQTSTSSTFCPAGATRVRPAAVTLQAVGAAVTAKRSSTGASGTFGAGVHVIV